MPTPFYHLSLASELLVSPALPEDAGRFLRSLQPAFLFGNTAPDVQVVSGQKREETHFYKIPLDRPDPAWQRVLEQYPQLRPESGLTPEQTAFLAGYLCHLQADQRWLVEIFIPFFGPQEEWRTFSERLVLHNILRSYLDLQTISGLPTGIGGMLESVELDNWIPFVTDRDLARWQSFLVRQLRPGASIETVEVFAQRQGISSEAYYRLLNSEEEMDQQIFQIIPRSRLEDFRLAVLAENVELLMDYLEPVWVGMASSRRVDIR